MLQSPAAVATTKASQPVVSLLGQKDLPEAARIVRLAFGAFFGAPDPETLEQSGLSLWPSTCSTRGII